MKELAGPYAPLLTPFMGANLDVDWAQMRIHLLFLAQSGLRGVLALGTQGEFYSLSFTEKLSLLEQVAENRKGLKLIAGIGGCSLREAMDLAKHAEKLRYDSLLVMPPFYPKGLSQEGMLVFFETLKESCSLPMLYYHIPQNTGVEWDEEWVESLVKRTRIWGLKDSMASTQSLRSKVVQEQGLKIFVGNDRQILEGQRRGAFGSITALANVFPEKVIGILHADETGAGDREQQSLAAIRDLDTTGQMTPSLKAMLELRDFPASRCRPPLLDLSLAEKQFHKDKLRSMGVWA